MASLTRFSIEDRLPVAQFEVGTAKNFIYLAIDWGNNTTVMIDSHKGVGSAVLNPLQAAGLNLVGVALTHTHWDHIGGLDEVAQKYPGLSVWTHRLEQHRLKLSDLSLNLKSISEGESIAVSEKLSIKVIHTPGHSAGECSFLWADAPYLFTGDTLFIRDCGRTDLETGSVLEMYDSLQKIKQLPYPTVILPGHHYKEEFHSTLEEELRTSPPLLCQSAEELNRLP